MGLARGGLRPPAQGWRFVVGGALFAATLVFLGSAFRWPWWTGTVQREGGRGEFAVEVTLQEKAYIKVVKTRGGGSCENSDECVEGSWCRAGSSTCLTDSDCSWINRDVKMTNSCARISGTDSQSWSLVCRNAEASELDDGGGAEGTACRLVRSVLRLTCVASGLSLAAAISALVCRSARRPLMALLFVIVFALFFGFLALVMSAFVNVSDASFGGPGSAAHCLALACVLLAGGVVLWRRCDGESIGDAPLRDDVGETATEADIYGAQVETLDAKAKELKTLADSAKEVETPEEAVALANAIAALLEDANIGALAPREEATTAVASAGWAESSPFDSTRNQAREQEGQFQPWPPSQNGELAAAAVPGDFAAQQL